MKRFCFLILLFSTIVNNTFAQTIDQRSVDSVGLAYNKCINKKALKFAYDLFDTHNFKNYYGLFYEFNIPVTDIKVDNLRYATRLWYMTMKKAKSLNDIGTNFDETGSFSFDEFYSVPNTFEYGTTVSSAAYSHIFFKLNISDNMVNIVVYCPIYTLNYSSKKLTDVIKGQDKDYFEFYPLSVYPFKKTNQDERFAIIYCNTSARCIILVQDWLDYVKKHYIHQDIDEIRQDAKTYAKPIVDSVPETYDLEVATDGNFSKVIETNLTSQEEYKYIRSYLAKTIKDYKSKSQIEDDSTGELVCELALPYHSSEIYKEEPYEFNGSYIIRLIVECKDRRFRIKGEDVKCNLKYGRLGGQIYKDAITGSFGSYIKNGENDPNLLEYKKKVTTFVNALMAYIKKQKDDDF